MGGGWLGGEIGLCLKTLMKRDLLMKRRDLLTQKKPLMKRKTVIIQERPENEKETYL